MKFSQLVDFVKKMLPFCGEAYPTVKKKQLLEHYGNEIEIAERLGEEDFIIFQILPDIVHKFRSQQSSSDNEEEKIRIILMTAKLIYINIKSVKFN
jgi:hypothetical protein